MTVGNVLWFGAGFLPIAGSITAIADLVNDLSQAPIDNTTMLLDLAGVGAGLVGGRGIEAGTADVVKNFDNLSEITLNSERHISDIDYDELRKLTPSKAIRKKVNSDMTLPMPDFAIPGKTITKSLQADHIVSMDIITRMPNFEKLTKSEQLQVLNNPDNFIGLSQSTNASKGNKTYEAWTTYKKDNIPINQDFRNEMISKEKELNLQLQNQINKILKERK